MELNTWHVPDVTDRGRLAHARREKQCLDSRDLKVAELVVLVRMACSTPLVQQRVAAGTARSAF